MNERSFIIVFVCNFFSAQFYVFLVISVKVTYFGKIISYTFLQGFQNLVGINKLDCDREWKIETYKVLKTLQEALKWRQLEWNPACDFSFVEMTKLRED